MAADGGLAAPPRPAGASDAWDEAVQRDPVAATLREKAERAAAEQAARAEELTVGGVIDDVLEVILQAEADGVPYGEIQAFLDDYLQGRWGDAASPLLQTIFRTNVQTAFNSLRYLRMAADTEARPFWRFTAVLDQRTSAPCVSCHGTTLAASDTWWATHWPPLHHRCRSAVVALTERDLDTVGGVTTRPSLTASAAAEGFGIPPEQVATDVHSRGAASGSAGVGLPRELTPAEHADGKAIAERVAEKLGIPPSARGLPNYPGYGSGHVFSPQGDSLGSNVQTIGAEVHGHIFFSVPGWDAWNSATPEERAEAILWHEWQEFNGATHTEALSAGESGDHGLSPGASAILGSFRQGMQQVLASGMAE